MSATKSLGSSSPVITGTTRETSDREATVVEVEGLYSALEDVNPEGYCPRGLTVESSTLSSTGDGFGKLTVRCVKYNDGLSFSSAKTTFRVDMQEVTYDLEDHPKVKDVRDVILKWLATEESKRKVGDEFKYSDASGNLVAITNETAIKFCRSYMSGIKTFNRYYPVIERISTWKNPPGLSRSGRSFTGGSPSFSRNVGTYDAPPITLDGFLSTNWFKSKDSWMQNADTTWTRTEQWTYTPESSSGQNAWIYEEQT